MDAKHRSPILLLSLVVLLSWTRGAQVEAQEPDPVDGWREYLYSDDPKQQVIGAHELLILSDPAGIETLVELLEKESPRTDAVVAVIETVASDAEGPRAVLREKEGRFLGALILAQSDPRSPVSSAAHKVFFAFRNSRELLERILSRVDDESRTLEERRLAVQSLGSTKSLLVIGPLIERLGTAQGEMAEAVSEALARITLQDLGTDPRTWKLWWEGDRASGTVGQKGRTREEILEGLVLELRRKELEALEDGLSEDVVALIDPEDLEELQRALGCRLWKVRAFAARQLGKLSDGKPVLLLLEALEEEEDTRVELELVKSIGDQKDPRGVGPLVALLERTHGDGDSAPSLASDQAELVKAVLASLGALGDRKAVEPLGEIAVDRNFEVAVRAEAVKALGLVGGPDAFVILARLAREESSPEVLKEAAQGLGRFGTSEAVEPLLSLLTHADGAVRWYAAEALGMTGDPTAISALVGHLSDPVAQVRISSVHALARLGKKEAVGPVVALLEKDTDPLVRRAATEALRKLGDASAIPDLVRALDDPDAEVRRFAWECVESLLGTDAQAKEETAESILSVGERPDLAAELFRELQEGETGPPSARLAYGLARAEIEIAELEAAIRDLERLGSELPAKDPLNWEARLLRVRALAHSGLGPEANRAASDLLKVEGAEDHAGEIALLESELPRLLSESPTFRAGRILARWDLDDLGRARKFEDGGGSVIRALEGFLDSSDPVIVGRVAAVLGILSAGSSGFDPSRPLSEQAEVLQEWREWIKRHE